MKKYFCIIGAQRSGTTFLYQLLNKHPQIFMAGPVRPEPKFFLEKELVDKGIQFYENMYFSDLSPQTICIGEKSASYIERPEVADRILSFYPDASIIVSLRNPVERAISNYYFSRLNGVETRSISEVFLEDKTPPALTSRISVSPFDYIGRGKYMEQLKPFIEKFQGRYFISIQEELLANYRKISEIYHFLGVDETFIPDTKNLNLNEAVRELPEDKEVVKMIYEKLNLIFKPHIQELEHYLGRSIELWNHS